MKAPDPQPSYDYDFRLHEWHILKAGLIAHRHKALLVRTMVGGRSFFNTMAAYSVRPHRNRARAIPAETFNVMRGHIAAARRIERKYNGHA